MSEPTEPSGFTEADQPTEANPPAEPPPTQAERWFTRPVLLAGTAGAVVGILVVVVLSVWGGTGGRVIVAAVGFCVAGLVLPWFAAPAVADDKTIGCILGWLSAICGVIGLAVGVWFGLENHDALPWWAYGGTGTVAAVAGGIGGGVLARRHGWAG